MSSAGTVREAEASRLPVNPAWRPDIQGLRAIAVITVVVFHAGLPLPGGFVGVDMFFVISGYVITAMLKRVANILGASHPAGNEIGEEADNRFDIYIFDLHKIMIANRYPATHYQLLEIAKDILEKTKYLFGPDIQNNEVSPQNTFWRRTLKSLQFYISYFFNFLRKNLKRS